MRNGETIEGFLYKMSNNPESGIPDVYYFMGIYQAYKDLHISTKQLDDFLKKLSFTYNYGKYAKYLGG